MYYVLKKKSHVRLSLVSRVYGLLGPTHFGFYTDGRWVDFTQKALIALRIQFNDGSKMLLGVPRRASLKFAQAGVDDVLAVMRKKTSTLLLQLSGKSAVLKIGGEKIRNYEQEYIRILNDLIFIFIVPLHV